MFWTIADLDAVLDWPGAGECLASLLVLVRFSTANDLVHWVAVANWVSWFWNFWTLWLDAFSVSTAFVSFW